ncbi:toprim domain-containing protein [Bacillus thuringiensis]|uniref:toprim domain-containing protein n=1 Tax=Bacillus thuringiensis TaxID=1428 RepID=UPI00345B0EED
MIKVRERELLVDVAEELEAFNWDRGRPRGQEFTACSPFRNETHPSFSINLETGLWIDFSSNNDLYSKGGIVRLLSYLREETEEETENYLLDKYTIDFSDIDKLELGLNFEADEKPPRIISLEEYQPYAFRSPYLAGRGINEKVQLAFKVGFDRKSNAIALPWHDWKGNMVNIKFRSTKSKQFYYFDGGQQLRFHVYGLHMIHRYKYTRVWIVESEIDALYLWSHGIPAVAIGGSKLPKEKIKRLKLSPIKELVIATDNDPVGWGVKQKLIETFTGTFHLEDIVFPHNCKDVNEIPPNLLRNIVTKPVGFKFALS